MVDLEARDEPEVGIDDTKCVNQLNVNHQLSFVQMCRITFVFEILARFFHVITAFSPPIWHIIYDLVCMVHM